MSSNRSRASARRREAILDATLTAAAAGGYEAVQMRAVAERVGIAVGTLYRYFPSKTHLLVSALTREFERLDISCDWSAVATTPQERLGLLTARLHDDWQRDPQLTAAMTRAFVIADTSAAGAVNQAAGVIEGLLATTLAGGEPTDHHRQIAGLIADVWLANLTAFISNRATAAHARDHIDRAVGLLLIGEAAAN
ncbi:MULTISPECIES: TetR family transcriptional regulator [unclassified Mycobacterium]|uniref:TetR family transcriptional regulator n=1 Tax=unclassified Mycobacterium TaxID=2642494 RepID=UPI0007FF3100|nr:MULTISPECIES: TetR family transcriptional regulator [unclassified Mycobacterium]OBG89898.1 TetR family transcriptional regulator [Mycobacterium sp. E136]OBK82178.1 TetR family transcriptional regulator [Mycobacterium sp. 1164985.4]